MSNNLYLRNYFAQTNRIEHLLAEARAAEAAAEVYKQYGADSSYQSAMDRAKLCYELAEKWK